MALIDTTQYTKIKETKNTHDTTSYNAIDNSADKILTIGEPYEILKKHIGTIQKDKEYHFWTYGRYAMHHVMHYVLSQIGPADIIACTWAIAKVAVEDILHLQQKGYIKSFKLWIDPRVRVRNPETLQMLKLQYPIAISPVHAKVTTLCNENWKVSIFGSLNFTSNPQPERGCICTIPNVVDTDIKILEEANYERFNG